MSIHSLVDILIAEQKIDKPSLSDDLKFWIAIEEYRLFVELKIGIFDDDAPQTSATVKRTEADHSHGLRNDYVLQPYAIVECMRADCRHELNRNGDLRPIDETFVDANAVADSAVFKLFHVDSLLCQHFNRCTKN